MKLSARNVLRGKVEQVTKGAVNSEVVIALPGGGSVAATITNRSVELLGLHQGGEATAIVKASSVLLGTDLHDAKLSARNIMCGTVKKIAEGPVSAEIEVEIGGGNTITSIITDVSARSLGLKEGGHACVVFKASNVIVGVE